MLQLGYVKWRPWSVVDLEEETCSFSVSTSGLPRRPWWTGEALVELRTALLV